MKTKITISFFLALAVLTGFGYNYIHAADQTDQYVHHRLKVSIDPAKQMVRVTDTIRLPRHLMRENQKIHFLLHGNLSVTSASKTIKIQPEKGQLKAEFFGINTAKFDIKKRIPLNHYSIRFLTGTAKTGEDASITLHYEGSIHHPIKQIGAEYARGFSQTPGIVSPEGVYLAGASFWVPWFNDDLVTFHLETSLPYPYDSVSQGKRTSHKKESGKQVTVWESPEPMDEIYLTAARFKEFGLKVGKVNVMAFLRSHDEGLANKYLETTGQYLEMYEKLVGPYPYSKFALIENFWETGYGMPSFTLLGSKIIRFPFILHSSYPHELLHNWWGNSVFVDYDSGNWCEGLTVFMADHLIKQQRSQGEEYRKTTLQGYTHYAAGKKEEFPLTQFKARYNALSSSIGYGKTMMLFHMLRHRVGDKPFKKALQHFYKENKFKRASFDDIRQSFEAVTGKDFKGFFHQWVNRAGAPEIRLADTSVNQKENAYMLKLSLEQIQRGEPYTLTVPVAVTLEGEKKAVVKSLILNQKRQQYEFRFDKRPMAVDVDPQFDVFRRLHDSEIPATFSNAFGAKAVLILLPSKAPEAFLKGYRQLADTWAKESGGKIQVKMDNELSALPSDKALWLFGWDNIHMNAVKSAIPGFPARFETDSVIIRKQVLPSAGKSIIMAVKNKANPSQVVVLLSADRVAAMPGLARKLPHYGKYSYLAFEGDEPTNMFKGQWPAVNSPLSTALAAEVARGRLTKQQPLARLSPLFSSKRMMEHVGYLASKETRGRGLGSPGLEKSGEYIAEAFKKAGLKPGGPDNSYFQSWEVVSGKEKKTITLRNVIGMIPGKNPAFRGQATILSAHYDHLGLGWPDVHKGDEGKIHYGADDNASGVGVMLELAHILGKSLKPERTILFIAFTGEESGLLGSAYFVEQLKKGNKLPVKTVTSVVNLDTVGGLTGKNKLMVIGGSSAREWRFIFMGIGYTVGVESQMVTQPLASSDQESFIKAGIPGIQLFSGANAHYHRPTDTIDNIHAPGLVKVAAVAKETIVYLSQRKDPLTAEGPALGAGAGKTKTSPARSGGGRRVRTGVMPDFAFSGKGVRIGLVSPESPAHKVGIQKGDVIVKLGDTVVANLREYSNALKTYKPGDTVTIVYMREGKEYSVSITLGAR
ncbi:MAG: M20/M25/M40 family metallo-hydrolase [bacterium]|nr:M20/M25/M40 family metallo-hydrolase [bacterium]